MKLITYLTFAGNCEEALNFYKEALGAEVLMVSRMGDGQMEVPENLQEKIMHARLRIGENELYMSDTFDPSSINKGNNVSLSIQIDDAAELKRSFDKLSAGGNVTYAFTEKLFGQQALGCLLTNLAFTGCLIAN
jgi:PhnB protein